MDLDARYELLETVGTGSFAKVYRARDRELGREVAIKQIHEQYLEDPAQLDRFWQEAQLLASLSHPNIVTIYDLDRDHGWVIMELMQANLAERVSGRQMPISSVRTTLAHGLRALKYLHDRGIVHGDVKPSNLMIDARRRIKLGDFGLARRVSDEDGSLIKGTTKYMAPEVVSQEFGDIGPASDLYSLGFCAYELMCGENFETLFPGLSAFGRNKQIAWMMWHAAADRRLPPVGRVLQDVPEDLAGTIDKLIEKSQTKRYASAASALADLKLDAKTSKQDDAADLSEEEEADEAARKKRLLFAGGALAISLLLCLFLLFYDSGPPPAPPKAQVRLVMEVDPEKNLIKVEDLDRSFAEEIDVGQSPKIYLTNIEQNIVLRELQPGDRIEIESETQAGGGKRMVITAARPILSQGILKAIDRTNRRILVAITEGSRREELDLRVPERAQIETLDYGKPAKRDLRDVKLNDAVQVLHLDELGNKPGRFVVKLSVRTIEEGVGFIVHLNPQARELTVALGKHQNAKRLMLPVAKDCEIELDGRPVPFDELKLEDRVRFRSGTEFLSLRLLRDQTLPQSVIETVNLEQSELKIQDNTGKRRTIQIPDACEITIGQEEAKLGDLRPYDTVDITWHDTDGQPEASSVLVVSRITKPERVALLIGIEKYTERALTPLAFPVANVQRIRQTLIDRYAFNPDRIHLSLDQDRTQLRLDVEKFLENVPASFQVIVYLCSHVYEVPNVGPVIAARQFDWNHRADTGVPLAWLLDTLEKCPSKNKLLLLDTCHPGQGTDLSFQPPPKTLLDHMGYQPKTLAIIGNCSEGERGVLLEQGNYSLFAYEIAQGFGGKADANRDLTITKSELFNYLKTAIRNTPIPGGKTQNPVLIDND